MIEGSGAEPMTKGFVSRTPKNITDPDTDPQHWFFDPKFKARNAVIGKNLVKSDILFTY